MPICTIALILIRYFALFIFLSSAFPLVFSLISFGESGMAGYRIVLVIYTLLAVYVWRTSSRLAQRLAAPHEEDSVGEEIAFRHILTGVVFGIGLWFALVSLKELLAWIQGFVMLKTNHPNQMFWPTQPDYYVLSLRLQTFAVALLLTLKASHCANWFLRRFTLRASSTSE